ncbi:exodeoxyribonuclease VII small subunit [Brumimicrobium aurantiacum]|uniref:Exodeoxyribonuclease VII small subunit n=1 Tax=Brumimicrobium aurantiacum TaxID=1737063 RepID=A0A3E1EWU1_9FLAO|nr:exodeoxyribonuclease VII small subunit [Brumimicrobium aurantiacum]RFC53988.1 exodeoxyribonuclease VII small subunit [Brumimicrobium aurantiacum]
MKVTEKTTYEEALQRLKEIVGALEAKEVKIDDLSGTVIEAKELVDFCRTKLDKTEEDIKRIIAPDDEVE